ncbi:ATP-binding protein [Pseudoalteromonas sp. Of7M-16]|uniref:ATP-binding protein n=1 Tax=Pseudoalteromonas sp. Of7M-16 TaxID=2917756 RepID=UPI001EF5F657|nr:ATP-binding protein [Pseudoalteromonas sp. Of7M-16]MCG7551642.1 ATP-binding protein [Pseudoalteromonas sp. Of7M-16]
MFEVIDKSQLKRIEAVHNGFLYQHLYTVGCLLLAQSSPVKSVKVELDEDIEIDADKNLYIQVKTRNRKLIKSDIDGALSRFQEIQDKYNCSLRVGSPKFLIIANNDASKNLSEFIDSGGFPENVNYFSPQKNLEELPDFCPPPWDSVEDAFEWCHSKASELPFSEICAQTLVWKLAAMVQAASGGSFQPEHTFKAEHLSDLFEQKLMQVHKLPAPPTPYVCQENEPDVRMIDRIRIICGHSGAGKTAWLSNSCRVIDKDVLYIDASDFHKDRFMSTFLREIGHRLFQGKNDIFRDIFSPNFSELEKARKVNNYLNEIDTSLLVAIDNVHTLDVSLVSKLVDVTDKIEFILLTQPFDSLGELQCLLDVEIEHLGGWSEESITDIILNLKCSSTSSAIKGILSLTGGAPLFVMSIIQLALTKYDADLDRLYREIEQLEHLHLTKQEVLLGKLVDSLPAQIKDPFCFLCKVDTPLKAEEIIASFKELFNLNSSDSNEIIRKLKSFGHLNEQPNKSFKIHDSIKIIGKKQFLSWGEIKQRKALELARKVIGENITDRENNQRLFQYLKVIFELKDYEFITAFTSEEMAFELGIREDLHFYLNSIINDDSTKPLARFWALDSLVFDHVNRGLLDESGLLIKDMEELLASNDFGYREISSFGVKKLQHAASKNDLEAEEVMQIVAEVEEVFPKRADYQRVLKYNTAQAIIHRVENRYVAEILDDLINEYFEVLNLSEAIFKEVRDSDVLYKKMTEYDDKDADIKRLATAMNLFANILVFDENVKMRFNSYRLYHMIGAYESFIRTVQNLADDFVEARSFELAKKTLEDNALSQVRKLGLTNLEIDVKSQYAVILAYCGFVPQAEEEINNLLIRAETTYPYLVEQLKAQRNLIGSIKIG